MGAVRRFAGYRIQRRLIQFAHTYLPYKTQNLHAHIHRDNHANTNILTKAHSQKKTGVVSRRFASYRIQCRLSFWFANIYFTKHTYKTHKDKKHKQKAHCPSAKHSYKIHKDKNTNKLKKHAVRDEGLPVIASSSALSGHRDKGHALAGLALLFKAGTHCLVFLFR